MRDNQLLEQAHKLRDIPGVIVHGRYDVVCPVEQAYLLNQAWPTGELIVTPKSGHSATEDENVDALVRATTLAEHSVTFQAGLNEDLAATALWGAQQAEDGSVTGVYTIH